MSLQHDFRLGPSTQRSQALQAILFERRREVELDPRTGKAKEEDASAVGRIIEESTGGLSLHEGGVSIVLAFEAAAVILGNLLIAIRWMHWPNPVKARAQALFAIILFQFSAGIDFILQENKIEWNPTNYYIDETPSPESQEKKKKKKFNFGFKTNKTESILQVFKKSENGSGRSTEHSISYMNNAMALRIHNREDVVDNELRALKAFGYNPDHGADDVSKLKNLVVLSRRLAIQAAQDANAFYGLLGLEFKDHPFRLTPLENESTRVPSTRAVGGFERLESDVEGYCISLSNLIEEYYRDVHGRDQFENIKEAENKPSHGNKEIERKKFTKFLRTFDYRQNPKPDRPHFRSSEVTVPLYFGEIHFKDGTAEVRERIKAVREELQIFTEQGVITEKYEQLFAEDKETMPKVFESAREALEVIPADKNNHNFYLLEVTLAKVHWLQPPKL